MSVNDQQIFRGEIRALVFDGDVSTGLLTDTGHADWSRLLSETVDHNLVTNIGRQQMTKLIVAETATVVGFIGLSTSVTTPALTDTALTNEIARTSVTLSQSYLSYYQRYVALFTTTLFGSTGIAGAGLFDTATTGGNMWADASISVSKTTTQALVLDWRVQATTG